MSRELLSKALAELDNADSFGVPGLKPLIDEIQDELAKPEPEPDYRRVLKEINEFIKADILPEEIKPELAKPDDPVAWITTDCRLTSLITGNERTARGWALNGIPTAPLYTHPPAQQKPLSVDEIKQLWEESLLNTNSFVLKFARAIEQAHGITS